MADKSPVVTVVGGGLAGCEAAWQAARRGAEVLLYEMKPGRFSPAHKSEKLAELVCSNSFGSTCVWKGAGLLQAEMAEMGSLVMEAAAKARVPAGEALAVDRGVFSAHITQAVEGHPRIRVVREEVTEIATEGVTILAIGPLPSEAIVAALARLIGDRFLFFYDAIAPIVWKDSIDWGRAFRASRYGRGGDDYVNCPLTAGEYGAFLEALTLAARVPEREFEQIRRFSACEPIEDLAARGPETLRHGPMKPVGLPDPRTGELPHAIVQLRQDDLAGELLGLVGFQTRLKQPEQARIFRMIPALGGARFARFGSLHRNSFVSAPELLHPTMELRERPGVFFAGQISGVEGYLESSASGILAGRNAAARALGEEPSVPPPRSMIGALVHYITSSPPDRFQPMNANFGLLPSLEGKIPRKGPRRVALSNRALADLKSWV